MFLKDFLEKIVGPWIKRRDNPHEVTAAQVDAYTKAEIDDLIGSNGGTEVAGNEIFPVYAYGKSDKSTLGITTSGLTITFTEQPAFFSGVSVTCPAATLEVLPNVLTYVFITLADDTVTYQKSVGYPIITENVILIGTVKANATSITSNTLTNARGAYIVDVPL